MGAASWRELEEARRVSGRRQRRGLAAGWGQSLAERKQPQTRNSGPTEWRAAGEAVDVAGRMGLYGG